MSTALILLAAGKSSRMGGRDKLLEEVDGRPLLRDRAQMGLQSDASPVLVVLAPDHRDRRRALDRLDVTHVENPAAKTGMASSIKAGLAAVPRASSGALIMPTDMPNITARHVDLMIAHAAAKPGTILRAASTDGRPKSPTYLPRETFALFDGLNGDSGGRELLKMHPGAMEVVILSGSDPTLDLDTPQEWSAWRQAHRKS